MVCALACRYGWGLNMVSRRSVLLALGLAAVVSVAADGAALAEAAMPTGAMLAEQASHRFPQPVRAGDLVGRRVLAPAESQPVLGRVVSAARNGSRLDLLVHTGGVLGFGGRTVVVPMDAIGLLGEWVALLDIAPDQLGSLPVAGAEDVPVGADEIIRVGLAKPFH